MNKEFSVLHVVAGNLEGGAAKGAYWLHCALLRLGINSNLITNSKQNGSYEKVTTVSNNSIKIVINKLRSLLDKYLAGFFYNKQNLPFSTGLWGVDITKTKEYKEADIIHFHWINGGFISIKLLKKIDKPIIWTMRDMWPFTGGCHVGLDCKKYETGCGSCPQLRSNKLYDLSKFIYNRKVKSYPKSMQIIGISDWISSVAKQSKVFQDFSVKTISNAIDCKEFYPIDKIVARSLLGLDNDRKLILIGAQDLNNSYKGTEQLLEALEKMDNSEGILLLIFGNIDNSIKSRIKLNYKSFGYLHDTISLRLLYSAADVFVAPSLMDSFGKTLAESIACGTPVVCFDATGPSEIIDHKN